MDSNNECLDELAWCDWLYIRIKSHLLDDEASETMSNQDERSLAFLF